MTNYYNRYARSTYRSLGLLLATSSGLVMTSHSGFAQDGAFVLEELVVTAQRREQVLSDVPISISAYSKANLDIQGVRSIDDIAKLTPGLYFSRSDQRNGLASNISIRGIASSAGASTTGIYIDDTPIQSRSLGYSAFNSFPNIFDLERVEVLRGPQGTLFGAGSEGGTVRFITPKPDYSNTEIYGRSELATTEHGGPSYEAGLAVGVPLVEGRAAIRASGWYRRDGGWVDRVDWSRATHEVTGVIDSNSNTQDSYVFRGSLALALSDSIEVIPSIYYQDLNLSDALAFWGVLSDPDGGQFNNGNSVAAVSKDKFVLPALKVSGDLGFATLISNTSYFDRDNESINDYASFEAGIWAGNPFFPEGFTAQALQVNKQKNWTQELRLESNDNDSGLNWVIGAFYSHSEQTARQLVEDVTLPDLFFQNTGVPFEVVFGQGLADDRYTFVADPIQATDRQIAGFGQFDYDVTEKLSLTVGLRYAFTKVEASASYRGPVVGPPVSDSGLQKEEPFTPKFGINYDIDDDNMVYATVAKGFRIGGYNPRVGSPCAGDLARLGLAQAPSLYDSDSVWSYEVGAKNSMADGRVRVSSSAFYIDWSNIQQQIGLNQCGFVFVTNLGSATSKGFDIQIDASPVENLTLGAAIGYTNAKFDQNVQAGPGALNNLASKGDHVPGAPWTAALSAQYNFDFAEEQNGYFRIDYQYQAKQSSNTPGTNPQNGAYNPSNVFRVPETHQVSARLGATVDMFEMSVFVKNLFDSHPILSSSLAPNGPLYQLSTFRPRTFGVTGIVRY